MRFDSIRLRGLGPFKSEQTLDLTKVDGTLVAFCGVNGAGKTTLLELFTGALYRKTATRGTLGDLATARDAFVQVKCVNGKSLMVTQSIDANTGKGESVVVDERGAVLVESAKVSAYDAWARDHVTPAEVLYAGPVAVQRSYGFLDLKRSERVAVLLRALGIERYERMARAAAEAAKDAKVQCETLRRTIASLPNVSVSYHQERLAEAERNVARLEEVTEAARLALQRAQAAATDVARAMELAEQRKAAEKRLDAAKAQRDDLERRIAKNRELLGQADEIRAAVERDARHREALAVKRAERGELGAKATAAQSEERGERAALASLDKSLGAIRQRIERAESRLLDRERIAQAKADEERLVAEVRKMETALSALETEAARLNALALEGKDRRITGLRDGLSEIVDVREAPDFASKHTPCDWARETLEEDDEVAAELAGAPARIDTIRRDLDHARLSLTATRARLRTAEHLAARAGEMEAARFELDAAKQELAIVNNLKVTATEKLSAIVDQLNGLAQVMSDVSSTIHAAEMGIAAVAPLVGLREHLDRAETLIEERTTQLVAVRETIAAAEIELAALPDPGRVDAVDLGTLERQVSRAEEEERAERTIAAQFVAAVEAAKQNEAKRAELAAELAAAETEQADWTRIAQDLGRDGLQALEIDASIPELNTVANELLHSCHGTRFTVEMRTDRLSSDGKKTIEDLDVRVIDMQEGRDAEAETYSPGELVIVSEAIALAITTRSCRQSGVERPTLIRDETGAALSAENGRAYIRMLRRAAQLIGADKVLYVTHSPELQELADAHVDISADHRITVRGQQ